MVARGHSPRSSREPDAAMAYRLREKADCVRRQWRPRMAPLRSQIHKFYLSREVALYAGDNPESEIQLGRVFQEQSRWVDLAPGADLASRRLHFWTDAD